MSREQQPKPVHQMTAAQFDNLFKTEEDCAAYLVTHPRPEGISPPSLWQCRHLHLYVAEFRFRYNNRQKPDIFGTAIKGC